MRHQYKNDEPLENADHFSREQLLGIATEVYECGHWMGSCTCFDCAVPECDEYRRDGAGESYCEGHKELSR